jgi:hypothetical protein
MSAQNPMPPQHQMRLDIELPAELEAVYANFALITHTASEVVMDFARVLPNTPKAKIHARLIMTPMNAKLLHRALGENLARFEQQFGEIKTPDQGFESHPLGFKK